jgi:hypothetical protein
VNGFNVLALVKTQPGRICNNSRQSGVGNIDGPTGALGLYRCCERMAEALGLQVPQRSCVQAASFERRRQGGASIRRPRLLAGR